MLSKQIVGMILDGLEGDERSLKACSLVCREWLPMGQSKIHKSIVIGCVETLEEFIHYPAIFKYVDKLVLNDQPRISRGYNSDSVFQVLEEWSSPEDPDEKPTESRAAFLKAMASLRQLVLFGSPYTLWLEYWDFINAVFPGVRDLSLLDLDNSIMSPFPPFTLPKHISTLEIDNDSNSLRAAIGITVDKENFANLAQFTLHFLTGEELGAFNTLMDHVKGTLTDLTIFIIEFGPGASDFRIPRHPFPFIFMP